MNSSDKITSIVKDLQNTIKELETLKTETSCVTVTNLTPSTADLPGSCQSSACCSTITSEATCSPITTTPAPQHVNSGFFSPGLTQSWPKFKYLSGEIVGNLTKTRTMAMDDSNVIHSLGYKSDMHIKTDTLLDTITREKPGHKGFIGTVKASDGNTYFMPAYTSSIGKLDRRTGAITLEKKFQSTPQVRSGAEGTNGIIYMPSYTRTLKIYTYNTKTGETTSFTPEKPVHSGIGGCNHVWGAATDKKGEIYMPQVLGKSIAKIDKNGVFKYLKGDPVTSGVSGWTHKYIGAIYVEAVDKVFCLPRQGKKILIINCVDDSYEEIDLPADYLAVANKNKNFHGFLGPDGWVYSAFWADTKCFRINPHTNEIQWRDYECFFKGDSPTVKEGSGIMSLGTGYSTHALVKDKNVYLGLAGTSKAIKLEFS
jgi:hypothetical protein